MSVFLNFLKKSFDRVLICDSEFRYADETKTVIEKVVCFVYKDLFTGDKFYFWEADKELSHPHFDYENVLVIPFNAVAEGHAWLRLLHGKPINCWDLRLGASECGSLHRRAFALPDGRVRRADGRGGCFGR